MKRFIKIILTFSFVSCVCLKTASAQDFHTAHINASPITLNPAHTGVFDHGDLRAVAQFRSQWASVANKFITSAFAFDMPFKERWGLGGYIINNDASKLFNTFNMVVGASYNVMEPSNEKHQLTCGIQVGVIHKKIDIDEYVFDNQYSFGTFNTYLPSGENIDQATRMLPDLNFGILYRMIDYHKTFQPYAGGSIFHLLNPKEGFIDNDDARLPLKWVAQGGSKINIEEFTIDPKFLFMYQRNAMELNFGFNASYTIESANIDILTGFFYRWEDALIPMLGINYYDMVFQMSYDINVSDLNVYSQGRGGIEFSIMFTGFTRGGDGAHFAHPRPL